MSARGMNCTGRLSLGATVLALVAGCAMPSPVAREGAVVVTKVERLTWDALPEPGLFRIEFDATRMQQIRREAGSIAAPEGVDPYTTELRLLDREAEFELKSRNLCNGGAKLASPLAEGGAGSSSSGVFKCRPPAF